MHVEALMGETVPIAHATHVPGPGIALNVLTGHAEHCSFWVSYPAAHIQEEGGDAGTLEVKH
jgi:hypothetical protein